MKATNSHGVLIGVELGGTKMVVASGVKVGVVESREHVPTNDPESTLASVRSAIRSISGGRTIEALGLASFGPIDLRKESTSYGELLDTPKQGWSGVNVLTSIRGELDLPVGLDTDVNAALLAEMEWGAGRGYDNVAYLTVGTGIGGGIWTGGRVLRGLNHPEMGHVKVPLHPDDNHISSCPFHIDCLEGVASGVAVESRWGRGAEELGRRDDIRDDVVGLEAWYIARGIVSICSVIPLDAVIIGGGLSKLPGFHAAVDSCLRGASGSYPYLPFGDGGPVVVPPGLGDNAGALGAIELARAAVGW